MRLGNLVFPENAAHRTLAGSVLAFALIIACVRLLGAANLFTPASAALALLVVTAAAAVSGRGRGFTFPFRAVTSARDAWPLLAVGCATIGIAVLAARWLPVWHWDSLGYHLPYVNFFLFAHGPSGVPQDVPYLSTYPHNIELFTIGLRSMLPDERLIDLAQVPLGVIGAMAVGGVARLYGAERAYAIAAGCAWLAIPAVFLQLPSNYVDVGSAAFLLVAVYFLFAPTSPRTIVMAGLALGLFLGSKPSAPIATAVLGLILLVQGVRAKILGPTALALLLVVVFGGESYLVNVWRHGNPTWPVQVNLGPLHLPGTLRLNEVFDSSPELSPSRGPFVVRLLTSWITLNSPPVFDMRIGGYGALFLIALPFAVATLVRTRSAALGVAIFAIFLSPYPTWARFVMAFPGLTLALAAPHLSRLQPRARALVLGAAAAIAVVQIGYAWPGLAYERPLHGFPYHGPPLLSYAHMSDDERERAVGPSGDPTKFIEARKRVQNDETYALEGDTELAGFAWDKNLRYRVIAVPDDFPDDQVGEFLERERVRVFMGATTRPMGKWAQANPERVRKLAPCDFAPCWIYERL